MGKSFRKNSDNNKQANHRNFVTQDMIESGNFNGKQFGHGPRRAKNVDIESDYSDYDSDDDRFYR
jgi:hypothetical protein